MSWIELVAQRRPPQLPQGMSPPENAKDWFQIRNAVDEEDTAEILVYDSIGGFFGMWADEFIDQLNEVTASNIKLRLNSPGGSVFEGIAIANAIRHHPANVTVYVDSLAASIASVIMLAGNRVVMMPGSQTMIHAASTACYGNAAEMRETAELLQKQTVNIAMAYQSRAGGTVDEWLARMDAETWLNAEETVALGLADEIYMPPKKEQARQPEPAEAKMHRTWDLSMYAYAGRDKAPAPKIPQQVMPGQLITAEHARRLNAVADSITPSGIDLSNHIAQVKEPAYSEDAQAKIDGLEPGTITIHLDFSGEDFQQQLVELIRKNITAQLPAVLSGAVGSHSTAVKDGTWDAGAHEGRLPSPVPVATVRKMYGWYDSDAVEDGAVPKSACKLPHHFVNEDGTPGAASINGVRNALARLPQTQGLSDAERKSVEAHLRAHLNAFDGGDSEDHVHDDPEAVIDEPVQADDSPPAPHNNAQPMPHTPPDEEEEEEEGDEPPPDEEDEPTDEADDWTSVVGSFISPTSPGADDVFAHLREVW